MYNTLVLRIRGDGRAYGINLHVDGYFDIQWHDIYSYVLYTRGGPHWQIAKVLQLTLFFQPDPFNFCTFAYRFRSRNFF